MNSDPFGNQESGWDWLDPWVDEALLELTENTTFINGANPMPDQYLAQQSQVNMAGTSSNDMGVNISNTGTQNLPATEDPREKKKRIDKAYRDRCREEKRKDKEELVKLKEEIALLKKEIESMTEEKASTSRMVDVAANERNQLRSESRNLKRTRDHKKILVSQDQTEKLKKEVARLRSENVNYAGAIEEKKQLLEELLKLQYENRLLELKDEAHCMMIQKRSRNPEDQDQADH